MSSRPGALHEANNPRAGSSCGSSTSTTRSTSSRSTPHGTSSPANVVRRAKAQPVHHHQNTKEGEQGDAMISSVGCGDNLKATLVTLSMELEDRSQAAELLRSAIQTENSKYDSLEEDLEAHYAPRLKDNKENQNMELSHKIQDIEKMVQEKQEITGRIRSLVEGIKVEEGKTAEAVEEVRREGAEELQRSFGLWGEGEVARRERWVAKKTEEVRERTMKGLEPEVQRIQDQHKMDCLEVEKQLQEEERVLRQAIMKRHEESLSSQESRLRQRGQSTVEREQEAFTARVNTLLEEHQQQLHRLRGRLSGEKENQRKWHMDELRRHQEKHVNDLARLQASQQEQLKSHRDKFMEEKTSLQRHHNANLTAQKQQMLSERDEWEGTMRRKIEDEREVHTQRERARLARMRDAEIEKTIHALQTESVVLEKKAAANLQRRLEQMMLDHGRDKEALLQEVNMLTNRHDEEVKRQHRASQDLARVRRTLKERRAELRAQEEKLARLRLELEREQNNMLEEQRTTQQQRDRATEEHEAQQLEMERTIQEIQEQIERCQMELERRRREVDADHERVLQALHQEVKDKVMRMDAETASMREALATEQVKRKQMERMLKKYDQMGRAVGLGPEEGRGQYITSHRLV